VRYFIHGRRLPGMIRLTHKRGVHARGASSRGLGSILIWSWISCVGARSYCLGHIRAFVLVRSGTILGQSGALEHSFRDRQFPNTRNVIDSTQLIDGGLGEVRS